MELGPLWATWWLELESAVPEAWAGEQVDLLLVTNSEATLWLDGEPAQGLVSGVDHQRPDAMLTPAATAGQPLRARVEIACSGLFGWAELNPSEQRVEPVAPAFRLERCELARFDAAAWALAQDLGVLAALMDEPPPDHAWRGELLRELNRFCNVYDPDDRATWDDARAILAPLLTRRNGTRTHEITAVGHAHIDTAWLWPLEETYRKCVRSFATQLRLMERYPDYRFACSQAQQYAWIRDREPGLYARIKERARAGPVAPGRRHLDRARLQPPGGRVARAAVPLRPALLRARVRPPRRGVLEPRRVRLQRPAPAAHARRRDQRLPHPEAVLEPLHGARAPHLPLGRHRRLVRARALPARRHLQRRGDRARAAPRRARLQGPRAVGEQPARVRLGRRRRRPDGRDARDARARRGPAGRPAHEDRRAGGVLPRARRRRLARGGRRALPRVPPRHLHDPGAHEAREPPRRARAARRRAARRRGAASRPGSRARGRRSCSTTSTTSCRARRSARSTCARSRTWPRSRRRRARCGPARSPARSSTPPGSRGARWSHGLRFAEAPPCGIGGFCEPRGAVHVDATNDGFVLDNGVLRATLGRDGTLRSLVLDGREAMEAPGNVLELYDDRPTDFEAWDLDPFHLETRADCPPATSAEVVLDDPLRAEIAFERPIGERSRMRQTVRLDAEAARLEFHCAISWHEERQGAEGALPGRRARATGDLRDAVRRRRAPDALLDPPRRRPVRGARPPLRRSLRARLRRRAALRGDLRLVDARPARCG